ncbi:MAG: hypothetical protein ABJC13_11690 [Acidobacteriota bacterium]
MRNLLARLLRGLAAPRWPWFAALFSAFLMLPSLQLGFQLDDFPQRLIWLGQTEINIHPLNAFASVDGSAATNAKFRDLGFTPWWSAPDLKFALCRPLSAATHWLDFQLWPDMPMLMHLQSLAWLAGLVLAAGFAYRRILGRDPGLPVWVGGLAALLFALDNSHALPAAWLANRNALIGGTFGLLALVAHDRWRRDGWRAGALLAPVLLVLGLLSAEIALGSAAFLLAYALTLEEGPLTRRLASLGPVLLGLGAWVVYYKLGGFGARGSGLYVDPGSEPLRFLGALWNHLPALWIGTWTPFPADAVSAFPGQARLFALVGVTLAILLGFLFSPLLRGDRAARFFALGMLLSLVPSAATTASNRLLLFVSFGALGLVALLAGRRTANRWATAGLVTLLIFHLPLEIVAAPFYATSPRQIGDLVLAAVESFPTPPEIALQDVYVLNPPDYLMNLSYVPSILQYQHRALPHRVRGLAAGPVALSVDRLDGRTLRLSSPEGFFRGPLGRLFRSETRPLRAGDRVDLPGVSVQVLGVTLDGAPSYAEFVFDRPLEDPSLRFLIWKGEGYAPFPLPRVGERVEIPTSRGALERLMREGA